MKLSPGEKAAKAIISVLLVLLGIATLYPFWNSVVISLNVGSDTAYGGITVWPRLFTLDNYKVVLNDHRLLNSFLISVMRTISGTLLAMLFTSLFAYGLSRRDVVFKKFYMLFCIFTMYFGGGLIPYFLLLRSMGMMDTFWVMVIPSIINVWNMIVFLTFFKQLPGELEESATIDGCNHIGIFFRIIVRISGPVFATLALFTAVGHWNDWFTATIFINKSELFPIQTLLQQILNSNITTDMLLQSTGGNAAALEQFNKARSITTKSLTMATMVVATVPVMAVYPFLQRHFVKGVLVGSLKG